MNSLDQGVTAARPDSDVWPGLPRQRASSDGPSGRTLTSMAINDHGSSLRKFLRRLTASEAELDAEELQRGAYACGGVLVSDCRRGELARITGRLRTVVYTPRTNLPTLEAGLWDGSDLVTLVWLGRRHILGIEPGRQLTARGRIALREDRKVIFNPYYELEPPR